MKVGAKREEKKKTHGNKTWLVQRLFETSMYMYIPFSLKEREKEREKGKTERSEED